MHAPVLPGLFSPVIEQIDPLTSDVRPVKVWKRQRQTARAQYHRQRAIDEEKQVEGHQAETRCQQVLRILAAYWNAKNESPTALELLEFGRQRGERLFDVNSIRPRLFELVETNLIEARGKRKCRVSGVMVHTWAVREMGSAEPR